MEWWYIVVVYFVISTMTTVFAWADGDSKGYLVWCWLSSPVILAIGIVYRVYIEVGDAEIERRRSK